MSFVLAEGLGLIAVMVLVIRPLVVALAAWRSKLYPRASLRRLDGAAGDRGGGDGVGVRALPDAGRR